MLRVKAILWMVLPNVRKDALLTRQAKLINMFKVGKFCRTAKGRGILMP